MSLVSAQAPSGGHGSGRLLELHTGVLHTPLPPPRPRNQDVASSTQRWIFSPWAGWRWAFTL